MKKGRLQKHALPAPALRLLWSMFISFLVLGKPLTLSAQQPALTVQIEAGTLELALNKVRTASGKSIVYQKKDLEGFQVKATKLEGNNLQEVLTNLFQTLPFQAYKNGEAYIVVKKIPAKPSVSKEPGKIEGTVTDEENGTPVSGVTIRIGDNTITTDDNGRFSIQLKKGNYQAELSAVGFGSKKLIDIHVADDETISLKIPLKRVKGQLGTVTVSARKFRETGTIESVINEIRKADAVVSGIGREQITRSQDRDAAEVVKRISGVSIIQNRLVIVRGLPQRYNTVLLNNAIAPSFEPDSRAFSFDIMPAGLIDRIMIYKTAVPELPGDFAGGVIKIHTTDIPTANSFNVSYSASYNTNTTFRDFYEQKQGSKQWLGYDDGTYALPAGTPGRIDEMSLADRKTLTQKMNTNWDVQPKTAIPDQRFNLDFSKRIPLGAARLGVIGAFSYSNTKQNTVISQNTADMMGGIFTSAFRFTDQVYENNVRLNGMLNISVELNKNHLLSFKNLYTHMGSTNAVIRNGETGDAASDGSGLYSGQYIRQYIFSNSYRGIYNGQLSGKHTLFSNTSVNWMASYTKSRYDDPDQRYRTLRAENHQYYNDSSLIEPFPTSISSYYRGRRFFTLPETAKSVSLNIIQPFTILQRNFTAKAGLFFDFKERTFEFRQLGYLPDPEMGAVISEIYGKNNSYNASNTLKAYYAAIDIPVTKTIKIYGGVRIEDNQQQLSTYTWKIADLPPGSDGRVDLDRKKTSLLPSVNISYALSEKTLIRAAWSKTLNRPEFREISNFFYMDMMTYRLAFGNEDLKIQTDIDNYDLRFEHYPGAGEMFTAGLFYKKFKNPVEFYYYVGTSGYNNFQWGNAISATNYGAEIDLMLGLHHIFSGTGVFNKLMQRSSVLINAAYIHSTVDLGSRAGIQDKDRSLFGQSPYLINAAFHYTQDNIGLKLNVNYNVIGPRLTVVGNLNNPNVYEQPANMLDIGFSKRISSIFELKCGVQNVLNARFRQVQKSSDINKITEKVDPLINGDNIFQSHYNGATYTLGIGLKL